MAVAEDEVASAYFPIGLLRTSMNTPSRDDVDLDPLNAEIRQLRAAGNPLAAFAKLLEIELDIRKPGLLGAVRKLWDEHLFAGDCLLLEAGNDAVQRKVRGTPEDMVLTQDFLITVFKYFHEDLDKLYSKWSSPKWVCQVRTRSRLIQAQLDNLTPESLEQELREALDVYADAWPNVSSTPFGSHLQADPRPAWLTTPGMPDELAAMLRRFGMELGTDHPAWHFVAESVAYLYRPARRFDSAWTAETWILLAERLPPGQSADTVRDSRLLQGRVAKLRVECIEHGCGAVYPHPARAGYLSVDPLFTASIQNALRAAKKLDESVQTHDYRWSIELVGKQLGDIRQWPLDGPSAGLAFAVAILAAARKEELDAHVACTARLDGMSLALANVGDVLRKAAAQELADRQITEILVAHGQDVDSVGAIKASTTPPGWKMTLVPVEDLRAAYERMGKFPRITRAVKDYLRARSQRLLEFLCHPYERPSICRRLDVVDPEAKSEEDLYERLDDAELACLFAGQPFDKRLQLFADSGFGKSTLLVELEGTIAGADSPLIPVRVGAGFSDVPPGADEPLTLPLLDDELFRGSRQQIIKKMIQRLDWFADADSDQRRLKNQRDLKISERDLRNWLWRKIKHGEVMFLFDAADQTSQPLKEVAAFLKACRSCPAVVSGRPETKQTQDRLWGIEEWQTLYARGFDQAAWCRYFTATAADRDNAESRAEEIWENEDWQPLVRPPILAEQVKRLELEGKLRDSMSRYDLYTISLEELVAKGLKSLNATPEKRHRDQDWSPADVMNAILSPLAWQMLQLELEESKNGTFRGQVSRQAYSKLKASRTDSITLTLLWQIGVTIRMAILDQDGRQEPRDSKRVRQRPTNKESGGLSWRHLSFFEYFVGRTIASRRNEFEALAERYARAAQWRWPFRFALSSLAADGGRVEDLASLAECLIKYGNPFVVDEAIQHDHVKLDRELDELCRWLVDQHDYNTDAYQSDGPPQLTPRILETLEIALKRDFRDVRYLHAAWELLEQAGDEQSAVAERARLLQKVFLGEFPGLLAAGNRVALELQSSFVRCPPADKRASEDADHHPFVQGTPDGEYNEYPHEVVVSPFELMDFPVTNAQFELLAPSHPRYEYNKRDDQPVTDVTWFEARIFAIWAGADLPTEAQWEYAARAGSKSKYGRIADPSREHGYRDLDTEDELESVANYGNYVRGKTRRGEFEPNWWGFYDMLGNVWEWCHDWFSEEYYHDLSRSVAHDPRGPADGSLRVIRGGSWYSVAAGCRSANRNGFGPSNRYVDLGFRLARVRQAESVQQPAAK